MYQGKYSLKNEIQRWRPRSDVPRSCVSSIRLWPLRRDYHSGVLMGAGGTQHSDWPARVLANDISTRIDRQPAQRAIDCTCQLLQVTVSYDFNDLWTEDWVWSLRPVCRLREATDQIWWSSYKEPVNQLRPRMNVERSLTYSRGNGYLFEL